jgi:hypothetical protein
MEEHIFKITIDYRGHHRKGITTFNAFEAGLQQNLSF